MDLDHVAHFVPDSAAAGAALERLGFTLTPFSAQSHRLTPGGPLVPAGTGNRCVMLDAGYIEFLTPTDATPVAEQLRAAIARYVGVHLIAFGSAAPEADHARLDAAGFEPLAPVALQRPISTESGEDIARYGAAVWARYEAWWRDLDDRAMTRVLKTYYGDTVAHLVFERCTWHSAQHCRQLAAVLERVGIDPDKALTPSDLAGLPLPERLWE